GPSVAEGENARPVLVSQYSTQNQPKGHLPIATRTDGACVLGTGHQRYAGSGGRRSRGARAGRHALPGDTGRVNPAPLLCKVAQEHGTPEARGLPRVLEGNPDGARRR